MATHASKYKPDKKQYKIYDLSKEQDRKEFSQSVVYDTFALIKIPDEFKSSLSSLFDIYEALFASNKPLQCDHSQQYVGYVATPHSKQSIWSYMDYNKKTLFPALKDKNNVLYENKNEQKVYQAFSDYNAIADDVISAILRYQCKDEQSYIQCWNNLFPKNTIDDNINHNTDNKQTDDNNDTKHEDNSEHYVESAVYHRHRKTHNLSLNNLSIIHYFGDQNKKMNLMKNIKKDNNVNENKFPCEEHTDYGLVTLIMSNQPGLQVRDIVHFEWIDIEDIIASNNMDRRDVLVVISGSTLGTLMYDRVACYHSVKQSYGGNDRISFPLFCYADPNGVIDTSLIRPSFNFRITAKDQRKLVCSEYLAQNMHPSVNF